MPEPRTIQVELIIFKFTDSGIRFLLLKRSAERGGFWQPVTGGVHDGETLKEAAVRELREETGITDYLRIIEDVHYFEFDTGQYGVLKEYVFGVEVAPDTKIVLSPEHTEMKWCDFEEAVGLLKYEDNKEAFSNLNSKLTA